MLGDGNKMSKKYIGITVGPIFDTIQDASTPASMWFTSFLFSDLTRRICVKLYDVFDSEEIIIYSPYYGNEVDIFEDGVGKFHDRILFSINTDDTIYEEKLKMIINKAKTDTAV